MNKEPILSICIPTYNRGEMLKQSIQYMIPVCRDNNIQIIVSDNASPDNTQDIMKVLSNEYGFIHYHRHTRNIGSDDNFEYVLKMADTKYRWLMSDTCYVDDIGDLMSDLESADWDGYILGSPGDRGKKLPNEKRIYNESKSLMYDIGWHLTWISCMVYHQRLVDSFNFTRYKDSCFNQTALMFEPTANRDCNICFNPIEVKNLPCEKDSGWHYHVFDIMYKKWYLLIFSLPLYYPYEIKKKCVEDNGNKPSPLRMLCHLKRRAEGKWALSDVYRNRFFIKQANTNYYLLLIMGLCPNILIEIIYRCCWIIYVIKEVLPQKVIKFVYEKR